LPVTMFLLPDVKNVALGSVGVEGQLRQHQFFAAPCPLCHHHRPLLEGVQVVVHHHLEGDVIFPPILRDLQRVGRFGELAFRVGGLLLDDVGERRCQTLNPIEVQGAEVVDGDLLRPRRIRHLIRDIGPEQLPVEEIPEQVREVGGRHGLLEVPRGAAACKHVREHLGAFRHSLLPSLSPLTHKAVSCLDAEDVRSGIAREFQRFLNAASIVPDALESFSQQHGVRLILSGRLVADLNWDCGSHARSHALQCIAEPDFRAVLVQRGFGGVEVEDIALIDCRVAAVILTLHGQIEDAVRVIDRAPEHVRVDGRHTGDLPLQNRVPGLHGGTRLSGPDDIGKGHRDVALCIQTVCCHVILSS
jgi:hypothetical protein